MARKKKEDIQRIGEVNVGEAVRIILNNKKPKLKPKGKVKKKPLG